MCTHNSFTYKLKRSHNNHVHRAKVTVLRSPLSQPDFLHQGDQDADAVGGAVLRGVDVLLAAQRPVDAVNADATAANAARNAQRPEFVKPGEAIARMVAERAKERVVPSDDDAVVVTADVNKKPSPVALISSAASPTPPSTTVVPSVSSASEASVSASTFGFSTLRGPTVVSTSASHASKQKQASVSETTTTERPHGEHCLQRACRVVRESRTHTPRILLFQPPVKPPPPPPRPAAAACTHTRTHTHTHARTHAHIRARTHTHTRARARAHTHTSSFRTTIGDAVGPTKDAVLPTSTVQADSLESESLHMGVKVLTESQFEAEERKRFESRKFINGTVANAGKKAEATQKKPAVEAATSVGKVCVPFA
jgi:hypothetical protein